MNINIESQAARELREILSDIENPTIRRMFKAYAESVLAELAATIKERDQLQIRIDAIQAEHVQRKEMYGNDWNAGD